ncbi:MAG: copper chaperone PCu(A)C [Rhizobiales bacterium]|nr:copper chaperone PCu(A)C [Hyphomicrobiales bacterium]
MKKAFISGFVLTFLGAGTGAAENKLGGPWTFGSIIVEQAWAQATGNRAVAYLVIHNKSSADDYLLAVDSPAAKTAAIHDTVLTDGVAVTEPVPGGLDMPSHAEVIMQPNGLRIVLTGLPGAVKPGDTLPVEMVFRDAGLFQFDVPVFPPNAKVARHRAHGP